MIYEMKHHWFLLTSRLFFTSFVLFYLFIKVRRSTWRLCGWFWAAQAQNRQSWSTWFERWPLSLCAEWPSQAARHGRTIASGSARFLSGPDRQSCHSSPFFTTQHGLCLHVSNAAFTTGERAEFQLPERHSSIDGAWWQWAVFQVFLRMLRQFGVNKLYKVT